MEVIDVELPSGEVVELEVPEGATTTQINNAIRGMSSKSESKSDKSARTKDFERKKSLIRRGLGPQLQEVQKRDIKAERLSSPVFSTLKQLQDEDPTAEGATMLSKAARFGAENRVPLMASGASLALGGAPLVTKMAGVGATSALAKETGDDVKGSPLLEMGIEGALGGFGHLFRLGKESKAVVNFAKSAKAKLPLTAVGTKPAQIIAKLSELPLAGRLIGRRNRDIGRAAVREHIKEMQELMIRDGVTRPSATSIKQSMKEGFVGYADELSESVDDLFSLAKIRARQSNAVVDASKVRTAIERSIKAGNSTPQMKAFIENTDNFKKVSPADLIEFRSNLKGGSASHSVGSIRTAINDVMQQAPAEVKTAINAADGLFSVQRFVKDRKVVGDAIMGRGGFNTGARVTEELVDDINLDLVKAMQDSPVALFRHDFLAGGGGIGAKKAKRAERAARIMNSAGKMLDDKEVLDIITSARFNEDILSAVQYQFVDDLIFRNTPANVRNAGEFLPDGRKMKEFLSGKRKVMERLFSKEQIDVIDNFAEWSTRVSDDSKELSKIGLAATVGEGAAEVGALVGAGVTGNLGLAGSVAGAELGSLAAAISLTDPNGLLFKMFSGQSNLLGKIADPAVRVTAEKANQLTGDE